MRPASPRITPRILLAAATLLGATTNVSAATYSQGSAGTDINWNYGSADIITIASGASITGFFTADAGKIQLAGNLSATGALTLTQDTGASVGSFLQGIQMPSSGTTTLSGSSITLSGDIGTTADGGTLALTTTNNGNISLNVSLGRSGTFYIPAGFTANAGTGTITISGSGPSSSGWRSTPVTLTGGAVNISGNVDSGALVTVNNSLASTVSSVLSGGMGLTKGGAGTLTLSNTNTFTGTLTVNAGTVVASASTTGGNASATGNGNAIVVNSGGTLQYTGSRGAGYHQGAATINGGTLTFDAADMSFAVGNNITFATAAGAINGSGQLRRRVAGNKITVAAAASGSTISVAELNLYDNTPQFDIADGSAAADLTVSSLLTGGAGINKTGAGTLVLSGTAANSNVGGITLGAGTLEITGQIGNGTTGTYTGGIANSGVLKVNSASAQSMSGVISGAGSLTKSGNGTLTLSNAGNSYSGSTTVTAGTLDVSGLLGSGSYAGNITLSGGTLKLTSSSNQTLSGTVSGAGALQKTGSGTLSLTGASAAAGSAQIDAGTVSLASGLSLSLGSLTLGGNVTLTLASLSGYTGTAALAVSGTVTQTAGTLTFNLPTGAVSNGTYHLLSHSNAFADLSGFALGTGPSLGARQTASLANNAGYVDYVVGGNTPYWTGATDGAWDTTTTNWKLLVGDGDTQYITNDTVLFNDSATGTTSVTIGSSVSPASVSFDNSSRNYTLSGAAGIAGTGALSKSGTGTLTVNNANSYSGGTALAAGTLVVGNASALGSGAVALGGGTLDLNGTSIANDITLNGGAIAGNGGGISGVISAGTATSLSVASSLTLSGQNTYTGGTTVTNGTLTLGHATNTLANAGAVTVDGASATLALGSNSDTVGAVTLRNGGAITGTTGVLSGSGYAVESGSVSAILAGAGALTKTTSGTVTLSAVNTFSGGTTVSAGTLDVAGSGVITGAVTVANGATLAYSGSGTNAPGSLSLQGNLTKSGSGSLTLSSLQFASVSGAQTVSVSNGTLTIAGHVKMGNADSSGNVTGRDSTLAQTGGSIVVTNNGNNEFSVANWGGTSSVNLSGGTLSADTYWAATIGQRGTGNLTVSGAAAATFASTNASGLVLGGQSGSTGNVYLDGGSLTVLKVVKGAGAANFYFNGGTLKASASNASFMSGLSVANVKSGGANINSNGFDITIGQSLAEDAGSTGGGLTKSGAGTLTLSGQNTYTGATTVSNGTLSLGHATNTLANSGAVTVDGASATLALGSNSDTVGAVTLRNGGAITGSTGVLSGSSFAVESGSVSAILGGSGALTKTTNGTVVLSGANTYSGGTTVSAGTLEVSGSLAGNVAINGGALKLTSSSNQTLSGTVSGAGALQKTGSGTLSLTGASAAAGSAQIDAGTVSLASGLSLSLGSLTLGGNVTLTLASLSGYTGTAALAVSGAVTQTAGTLTFNLPTGAVSNGTYHLLSHSNAFADLSGFALGTGPSLGARQTASLANNAGYVDYVVGGNTPYWTGAASGAWDTSTTNWKLLVGDADTQYITNDTVLFNDSATGTTSVTIGSSVSPASVSFDNSSKNYTLSGAAGIGGAGSLSKSGTGSLTINNANSYSGGTTIGAGTVTLGNASALGSGAVAINGGTLDLNGTTVANNLTLAGGAIAGNGGGTSGSLDIGGSALTVGSDLAVGTLVTTGGFTKAGAAKLTLSGDNTYTGGTTVSNGTLQIGAGGSTGSVTGNITDNATVTFNRSAASAYAYAGVVSGTGALTVAANSALTLTGANTYAGSTTVGSGATLTVGNGSSSGSIASTAVVADGALVYSYGSTGTANLVGTTGSGSVSATARYIKLNADITLTGASSSINLTKSGSGTTYNADGIELVKSGTTTLTAGSITVSGDVGKIGADGNTLVLDTSAQNGAINLNVSLGRAGTFYIPTALTANAGAGTITVSGSGTDSAGWRSTPVTLNGGAVNIAANVSSGALVTVNNSLAGAVSGVLSGGMGLTKNGAGTLTLSGVNTFTGTMTVNAGTVIASASTTSGVYASSTGNANAIVVNSGATLRYTGSRGAGYHQASATINGGTLTFDAADMSFAAGNAITFATAAGAINGTGQLRRRASGNSIAVTAAASGSTISVTELNLYDTTSQFDVADGSSAADLTVSSLLTGGAGINKTGAGTLVLSGTAASSDVGAITLGAGTLEITGQIGSGTTGTYTGGIANSGVLKVNSASSQSMTGVISGTGSLTKNGNGVLTLSGVNTYSGGTTVLGGTLRLVDVASLGTAGVLVSGGYLDLNFLNPTNTITLNGGALLNAGYWTPSVINVTGSLSASDLNNLPAAVINVGTGASIDLTGVSKDIVVTGGASLSNLSGYTGTIELRSGGTLDVGTAGFGGNVTYKGGAVTGNFTGNLNVSGTNVTLSAANLGSVNVVVGTGASVSIGSGLTSSIRIDGGTIEGDTLKNLTGTVTVASGSTLDLDGVTNIPLTASGASIVLEYGARLKGNATVASITAQDGSTLAPGNSPGEFRTDSFIALGGSAYSFEIRTLVDENTGLPAVAGFDYDTVIVSGELDLSALTVSSRLILNLISLDMFNGAAGTAQGWDPSTGFGLTLFSYGSLKLGEGASLAALFDINSTGFLDANRESVLGGHFSVVDDTANKQILLVYSSAAIPEPSTYGLMLGGLALAAAAVRRRKVSR